MANIMKTQREIVLSRSRREEGEATKRKVVGVYNVGTTLEEKQKIPPKKPGTFRFVCLSDTHNRPMDLNLIPDGDFLVHSGDFSMTGDTRQIQQFSDFLKSLPHKHKIVIAGNHDVTFEEDYYKSKWRRYHSTPQTDAKQQLANCIYLEDSEVTLDGITIYGSPWQPEFCGWAFNMTCGEECPKIWNLIPKGIDVLLTHGPPYGHGDMTDRREKVGCEHLLQAIKRARPAAHVFGHIHEAYGHTTEDGIHFFNASNCTLRYAAQQNPIVFDLGEEN
eukprot:TRINITY_DN5538_c0_g1_i1.p1 TRINITY_DN5538_c0_g1~~TRINITY_DN5538_c0_g1_i1.p1  ORF type:complete len:276 (+),score=59.09 TRINITY_DN5538_c0_g1_i1:74-901(+)